MSADAAGDTGSARAAVAGAGVSRLASYAPAPYHIAGCFRPLLGSRHSKTNGHNSACNFVLGVGVVHNVVHSVVKGASMTRYDQFLSPDLVLHVKHYILRTVYI